METHLRVLAFIIFPRDKTKQQRDGRGQVGGGGGVVMVVETRQGKVAVRDKPEETKWVTAESCPYRIVRPALSKKRRPRR